MKDVIEADEVAVNTFAVRNVSDGYARGLELEQRFNLALLGIEALRPLTLFANHTFLKTEVNDTDTGTVLSATVTASGDRVALGTKQGLFVNRPAEDPERFVRVEAFGTGAAEALAWDSDRGMLYVGAAAGALWSWDMATTPQTVAELPIEEAKIRHVAVDAGRGVAPATLGGLFRRTEDGLTAVPGFADRAGAGAGRRPRRGVCRRLTSTAPRWWSATRRER